MILSFSLFVPCGLWDFSSLTRDWTQALGSESNESEPLDQQGISHSDTFKRQFCSFRMYPQVSIFAGDKGTKEHQKQKLLELQRRCLMSDRMGVVLLENRVSVLPAPACLRGGHLPVSISARGFLKQGFAVWDSLPSSSSLYQILRMHPRGVMSEPSED